MGLAASQARFLAITARKADLEFRSLEVAQNKLSITQSLADVTDQYQKALNTTKLVWSNTDDIGGINEFSYSSLMYPSALNNYQAYLLTNRKGKIVLDDKYAKAAAATISPDGKPHSENMTVENYLAFIQALGERGVINDLNVSNITNKINDSINTETNTSLYDAFIGYGSPSLLTKEGVGIGISGCGYKDSSGNILKDLNEIYLFVEDSVNNANTTINNFNPFKLGDDNNIISSNGSAGSTTSAVTNIRQNGKFLNGRINDSSNTSEASNIKLMDLFTSNITYSYTWAAENSKVSATDSTTIANAKAQIESLGDSIKEFLKSIMYAMTNQTNPDSGIAKLAYDKTLEQFFGIKIDNNNAMDFSGIDQNAFVTSNATSRSNAADLADTMAQAYNKAAICACDSGTTLSFNLSNLAKTFLTYYEQFKNGSAEVYTVGATSTMSNYVTNNKYYEYEGSDTNGIQAMCIADFYMQMFNNICINGWDLSETVNENKSLEQLVKNGTYFVSSLAPDNYFYQTRYNEIDYVVEVKDEDAITQAEIEYEKQKAKLTYKEDKLDLEMKNLDAEIAELTTEYQSVQNLISKNVDKTFTYFQS